MAEGGVRLGRRAEDIAARFLSSRGLRIVARNFRARRSEVDLVAVGAGILVFVEVKCRRHSRFGSAMEAVDVRKRRRIVAAAREFWVRYPQHRRKIVRFDVVALDKDADGRWRIQWCPDAFSPMDL